MTAPSTDGAVFNAAPAKPQPIDPYDFDPSEEAEAAAEHQPQPNNPAQAAAALQNAAPAEQPAVTPSTTAPKRPSKFQPTRRKSSAFGTRASIASSASAVPTYAPQHTAIENPSMANPNRTVPQPSPSTRPVLRSAPPSAPKDHPAISVPSASLTIPRLSKAVAAASSAPVPKPSQHQQAEPAIDRRMTRSSASTFVKATSHGGKSKSLSLPPQRQQLHSQKPPGPSSQQRGTQISPPVVDVDAIEEKPSVLNRAKGPRANWAVNRTPINQRSKPPDADPALRTSAQARTQARNGRARSAPQGPPDVQDVDSFEEPPPTEREKRLKASAISNEATKVAAAAATAAALAADKATSTEELSQNEARQNERKHIDAVQGRHPMSDDLFNDTKIPRKANPKPSSDAPKFVPTTQRPRGLPRASNREKLSNGAAGPSTARGSKLDKPIEIDASPPRVPPSRTPAKRARSSPTESGAEDADPVPGNARRSRVQNNKETTDVDVEVREISESEADDVVPVTPPPMEPERTWEMYTMKENDLNTKVENIIANQPFLLNFYYMGLCDNDLRNILARPIPRLPFSRHIVLRKNRLTNLSSQISKKLHDLNVCKVDVSCNVITHVAPEIRMLAPLRILTFEENKLESVPDEICQLTDLEVLDLSYNKLTQLPRGFKNLEKLKVLLLASNKLTTFPKDFTKEGSKLHSLKITGNEDLGTVPECFKHLKGLVNFDMEQTKLRSLILEKEATRKPSLWLANIAGQSEENLKIRKKTGKFPVKEKDKEVVEVKGD